MSGLDYEPEQPRSPQRPRREQGRTNSSQTGSLTISTDGSEAISFETPARQRPAPQRRPYSDQSQLRRRIVVGTINEDTISEHDYSPKTGTPLPVATVRPDMVRRSTSAATSAISSPAMTSRSRRQENSSYSQDKEKQRKNSRSGPSHGWTRTISGSLWYERLTASSNKSRESVSETTAHIRPHFIAPLPPPPRSASHSLGLIDRHNVRIEKSFENFKESAEKVVPESPPSPRKKSSGPLRIFATSMQRIRRMSLGKRKGKEPGLERQRAQNDGRARHLADHTTVLKKDRTADALRRVNSILQETNLVTNAASAVSVVSPPRVMSLSEHSTSSKGSGAFWTKSTKTRQGPSPKVVDYNPVSAPAPSASYTSSQLALRMGAQPNNTPDEQATYKIKRSPSAETEEFFKVDISIRGGTSYLPSEARRVHTPPLPQDGPDGKKRGFFFDYNAPNSSYRKHSDLIDPNLLPTGRASRQVPTGKKTYHVAGGAITKDKIGDWYDAKLAQLEEESDSETGAKRPDLSLLHTNGSGRDRSDTNTSLAEIRKRKEEEKLDYNIPEHLPSSPLCPRHPRYWRIVKNKGSQFRGCWMHGIGEWEDGRFQ